jgi:tetratricopeptide (TPR) repeat protein
MPTRIMGYFILAIFVFGNLGVLSMASGKSTNSRNEQIGTRKKLIGEWRLVEIKIIDKEIAAQEELEAFKNSKEELSKKDVRIRFDAKRFFAPEEGGQVTNFYRILDKTGKPNPYGNVITIDIYHRDGSLYEGTNKPGPFLIEKITENDLLLKNLHFRYRAEKENDKLTEEDLNSIERMENILSKYKKCLTANRSPEISLAPEIEADRLLILATEYTNQGRHDAATAEFMKILGLDTKLPDEFYYQYGRHFYATGDLEKAKRNFEIYLTNAGAKGQYYRQGLKMLTEIEKTQNIPLHNAQALTGLKNAVTCQEAYHVDNGTYAASVQELKKMGLELEAGVKLFVMYGDADKYTMKAFHERGSKIYKTSGSGYEITNSNRH